MVVAAATPPVKLATGRRNRDTLGPHPLEAQADRTAVRQSAATAVACWLVFSLLILFYLLQGTYLISLISYKSKRKSKKPKDYIIKRTKNQINKGIKKTL